MSTTRYLCLFLTAVGSCLGQGISPSELKVRSADYTPPQATVIRATSRIVEVPVVVRDKDGKPVAGLSQQDFEIRDSGKKTPLAGFSVVTAKPLAPSFKPGDAAPVSASKATPPEIPPSALVLLFDERNSTVEHFLRVRDAAAEFVRTALIPGRKIAVATLRGEFVTEFLDDPALLVDAIRRLNPQPNLAPSMMCPTFSPFTSYLVANNLDRTALEAKVAEMYGCDPRLIGTTPPPPGSINPDKGQAVTVIALARQVWQEQAANSRRYLTSIRNTIKTLARQPGKRTLLLAGDGFYAGTLLSMQQEVINEALRASVVLDALDAKGLSTGDEGGPSKTLLDRAAIFEQSVRTRAMMAANDLAVNLSASTGGHLYTNSNDLGRGYTELMAEPEVSYLLGFVPNSSDGEFHRLKVDVPGKKGLTVDARLGYVADKDAAPVSAPVRRLDTEVFTTSAAHDVPLDVSIGYETVDQVQVLRAAFGVDLRTAKLVDRSGARRQTFRFIVALLDLDGNFVVGKEGSMELALKKATLERLAGTRLDATLQLDAPPGTYRLRVLIEEQNGGGLTAATQEIRVP